MTTLTFLFRGSNMRNSLVALATLSVLACQSLPETIHTKVIDFDVTQLESLTPYSGKLGDSRYVLLTYFNELSCRSCVNQNLEHLANLHTKLDPKSDLELVLVANDPASSAAGAHRYLNDMRRIGRVEYPILLEAYPGQLGLEVALVITLIDRQSGKQLVHYTPMTGKDDWPEYYAHLQKEVPSLKGLMN